MVLACVSIDFCPMQNQIRCLEANTVHVGGFGLISFCVVENKLIVALGFSVKNISMSTTFERNQKCALLHYAATRAWFFGARE